MHIQVLRVDYEKRNDRRMGVSSKAVRRQVEVSRKRQCIRLTGLKVIESYADMRPAEVRKFCDLDSTCTTLMKTPISQPLLSARAFHWVYKMAEAIANLARCDRMGLLTRPKPAMSSLVERDNSLDPIN